MPDGRWDRGMPEYFALKLLLGTLMVVVLVTGVFSISQLLGVSTPAPQAIIPQVTATPSPQGTAQPGVITPPPATPPATAAPPAIPTIPAPTTVPGVFGIFDQSGNLASYSKYLVATLILIVTVTLEMFLVIMWGALFVNDDKFALMPLGLPIATVRVFLILLVILVILLFTLLPDQWGSNKAVVLLFGLLSTIIGFYFGSRASAEYDGGVADPVKLTLDPASKTVKKTTNPTILKGTLEATYKTRIGTSATVVAVLLDSAGLPTPGVQLSAVADSEGKVEFTLNPTNIAEGSYILRVVSPAGIRSDERVSVSP